MAHYDEYDNIACVITGRKQVWLLPFEGCTPDCTGDKNERPTMDPRVSGGWLLAILEPGHILVIPARWWHYVISAEHTVMVNIWLALKESTQRPTRRRGATGQGCSSDPRLGISQDFF